MLKLVRIRHAAHDRAQKSLGKILFFFVIAILVPFVDFLRGFLFQKKIGEYSKKTIGIFHADNHLCAIKKYFGCIEAIVACASPPKSGDYLGWNCDAFVLVSHLKIVVGVFFKVDSFFKILRMNKTHVALLADLLTYNYTLSLLSRGRFENCTLVVADSFSSRHVAAIDFFLSINAKAFMVQHGLIQNTKRYRSHANYYLVWNEYEMVKVIPYVSGRTMFCIVGRDSGIEGMEILRDNKRYSHILIVMNPFMGIGESYPRVLIDLIREIVFNFKVKIRLHPSDSKERFLACFGGKNVDQILSTEDWRSDLIGHKIFLCLNSTCIVDVLDSNGICFLLGQELVGYDRPKIHGAENLVDISNLERAKEVIGAVDSTYIKEIGYGR